MKNRIKKLFQKIEIFKILILCFCTYITITTRAISENIEDIEYQTYAIGYKVETKSSPVSNGPIDVIVKNDSLDVRIENGVVPVEVFGTLPYVSVSGPVDVKIQQNMFDAVRVTVD